ncbi:MAG: translation initiation factor IF-2 N-terminal domain-containing protein [Planctomycetes bacterium]|nr:translation initiation factor IF-2 N-terminal domain-containing protein [Planctomycetota bacterium]
MADKLRVHTLANELGVPSKTIVEKCVAEGIDTVKNHMSTLSAGLHATIREWFSESGSGTALETAERVDLTKERKKVRRRTKATTPKTEQAVETEQEPVASLSAQVVAEAPALADATPDPAQSFRRRYWSKKRLRSHGIPSSKPPMLSPGQPVTFWSRPLPRPSSHPKRPIRSQRNRLRHHLRNLRRRLSRQRSPQSKRKQSPRPDRSDPPVLRMCRRLRNFKGPESFGTKPRTTTSARYAVDHPLPASQPRRLHRPSRRPGRQR